jgi:L-serine kinase (ADP)
MTSPPEFRLLPIARLRGHEEHDPAKVDELAREMLRTGRFVDPIWVARDSWVILNGHHRVEALRKLGLKRVPAWILDYDGEHVDLDRWAPGPPIEKREVLDRAHQGQPFPPKTTRHRLRVELPSRSVPLAELGS